MFVERAIDRFGNANPQDYKLAFNIGGNDSLDGDGLVFVDELLTLVNIALGNVALACEAGDFDADGVVTVDEVLTAVGNALNGCPA